MNLEDRAVKNRVALVTGAASGIGKACARLLAATSYRVGIADLDAARLADVKAELSANGGEVLELELDIADEASCQRAAQRLVDAWGRIDTLVANAGVQTGGRLLDTTPEEWTRILQVNLNGTAYCSKAVLPVMQRQKSGSIVIVSSVNALVATPGMTVYDMSKAAVLGLTRSLAAEHGAEGIRVNAVCPGNTLTDYHIDGMARRGISVEQIREMTRGYGLLGRIAEPEEIASAIAFLAGEQAAFITGQALAVDGGFSVMGAGG